MRLIREHEITLTQQDNFTSKFFEFFVPEDAMKLVIRWEYSPRDRNDTEECKKIADRELDRYLTDPVERKALLDYHVGNATGLRNQLDVSLFEGERFCGNGSHKYTIEIADGDATPGFLPGTPHGRCKLLLNVHCVYTERCDVRFRVECE